MIEIYRSKKAWLESMQHDGTLRAIEKNVIDKLCSYLTAVLDLRADDCSEQQINNRITQSSRHLYIGSEVSQNELEDAKAVLVSFFADIMKPERNNESSAPSIGGISLTGLVESFEGKQIIDLNRLGLRGSIRIEIMVERDSCILGGPAIISLSVFVVGLHDNDYDQVLVIQQSKGTYIPKELEKFLSYVTSIKAQGLIFEDEEWKAPRFDELGSIELILQILRESRHTYIGEHEMLSLSRFTDESLSTISFDGEVTYSECYEYMAALTDYYTNTYMSSLEGYQYGEFIAYTILAMALKTAKEPEQHQALANRLVNALESGREGEVEEMADQVHLIIHNIRELTNDDELDEEEQLKDGIFMDAVYGRIEELKAEYEEPDSEWDDWD